MHTWEYCWDQGQKELQGFKTISFLLEKTLTVRNGRALGSIEQLFQGKFKLNLRWIEMTSVWFSFCKIHSKSNLWQQTAATSIDQCFEWRKKNRKPWPYWLAIYHMKCLLKKAEETSTSLVLMYGEWTALSTMTPGLYRSTDDTSR